jgi:hypothetical protein
MKILLAVGALLALGMQAGELPQGVTRSTGVDAGSGIAYVLISVEGKSLGGTVAPAPRLTAQCTRGPGGKLKFELLADLGGVSGIAYYPPWKPTSDELFPPRLGKEQVTMEFLGYTKVKPVKRQWDDLLEIPGEMRYATPGMSSANMEQIMFYLQYLRPLPTLRLTVPGKGAAEWDTANWQKVVHAEPLCAASGL